MRLETVDIAVIVAYLAGITLLGWYFSRRQKTIRDYFLSDRDIPWWALSASIVATETSVVTFISVPAFAFAANSRGEGGNFTFLQLALGYLAGRFIIVALFIPLYFRGEIYTVYQLLDRRFGPRVKRAAASLFVVTRSLSDGVRIYATALVLVAVAGWTGRTWADPLSILIIGGVMIVFTYLGGISAVIWTEVVQLLIYNLGAVVAAILLLNLIPGGWSEVVTVGRQLEKFQLLDFSLDVGRSYTFWAGVVGGAFLTTSTHGADQFLVQRYLCAKNARQAGVALLSSGVVVFAQFAMFLLIGVMLFAFYRSHPTLPPEVAASPDRIFPHFIANELPNGVVGLVIAAILAAALSSSLNALASTTLTDFYRPLLAPERSEAHYLNVSRWLTVGWGVLQVGVAMFSITMNQRVVDVVLSIASFTNGPILGLFLLATLTRRVRQSGALAGVAAGVATMVLVWTGLAVSWQWYVLIGSAVTFAVGYATSVVVEREPPLSSQPEFGE